MFEIHIGGPVVVSVRSSGFVVANKQAITLLLPLGDSLTCKSVYTEYKPTLRFLLVNDLAKPTMQGISKILLKRIILASR